jgi:hypothetical protein
VDLFSPNSYVSGRIPYRAQVNSTLQNWPEARKIHVGANSFALID